MTWHIGCSGFYYDHWRGSFYPDDLPKSKWFDFYKDHFNTLELNVTFYRFPRLATFESWYKKSPDNFSFTVKAPRIITHFKQFNDTREMMTGYYATMLEGLKEKLGCVLFQLPPRTKYSEEKLQQIVDTLDPSFNNVVEFRHESWWIGEVYDTLKKNKITFSGVSHPSLPEEAIVNHRVAYYRFHGRPHLYRSEYKKTFLEKIVNEIGKHPDVHDVYVYFNNDIDGHAITNAQQMQKMV